MSDRPIRQAEVRDLAAIDAALAALSKEIGDPHLADREALREGLFGPSAFAAAYLAEGDAGLAGIALYAPVLSTVRGGAGVFVSDIWVDEAARGEGLGGRLLGCVAKAATARWGARFMRLSVHDDNLTAHRFYDRLGFRPVSGETTMVLAGHAFERLGSDG